MKPPPLRLTTQQIAWVLGISNTRVQQIEKRALAKLRELLRQRGITPEDLRP